MRKQYVFALFILSGVLAGILIASLIFAVTGKSVFGKIRNNPTSASQVNNAELTAFAYRVLEMINEEDFNALSRVTHPELGLVFSPHATISLATNKCFQAEQVAQFGTDAKLYVWGVYSSSGSPIELTVADYFAEFVKDMDYTDAAIIGVNHIVRSGNALENITDVMRDALFIDFHIPGSRINGGEDYEWSSLRLGFEEYDGSLWLTLILRSTWTD